MRFIRTRWTLAVLCMLTSIWLMKAAFKIAGIGAAGPVILSLVLFVSTVLLIAPETAFWLAEQIGKPFAALFYPSDTFKKPPLCYRLARRYRKERRWEEALAQYESIIEYYPDERDAHLEILEVARELGDEQIVEKYTALILRRLNDVAVTKQSQQDDELS